MAKLTPQTRAMRELQEQGWTVDVVEHINRWGAITKRKDLFGGFDLLAVDADGNVAAIQVTSRSNVSARVAKIAALPVLPMLRRAGWGLYVWGWDEPKQGWRVVDVS